MDAPYTSNPQRLVRTVRVLSQKKQIVDDYYKHFIFRPYKIDIKRCIVDSRIEDAKRLLDFCFTSRQGGQNKTLLSEYQKNAKNIRGNLKRILEKILNGQDDAQSKYNSSLSLLHPIESSNGSLLKGIGQKISTMFIKFLIYYSDDFPGKDQLLKELFIPFDTHVLNLLFSKVNGEKSNRLKLYHEDVNQASLRYDFRRDEEGSIVIKSNKLFELQKKIQNDFRVLKIEKPPIILDYLWYVGRFYCRIRLKDSGCKICFLIEECENGSC